MRGLGRTVLGVLATTVAAAGVLAPTGAQAATTAIHWKTFGGTTTLTPSSSVEVCNQSPFEELEVGQTVVVQVLLGGVWTTRKEILLEEEWPSPCVEVRPSELVPGPGKYSFRAQFRPSPEAAVLSASVTYTLVKEGSGAMPSEPTAFYSLTTTQNRSLYLDVFPDAGQFVDLQRRQNGTWVTISRATAPTDGFVSGDVKFAVPTRAGNSTYRAVVRGTTWSNQGTSQPFVLHQTNYAKHESFLAIARKHMARYCPRTPIYIDTPDVVPGNPSRRNGQATTLYRPAIPGKPGFLEARIELQSALTGTYLKHVALHECAHVVQTRAVVKDKLEAEQQRAWELWPRIGEEGQADCMSYVVSPKLKVHFSYATDCTPRQVYNATRMWRDYGLAYQANPYVWEADWSWGASLLTSEQGTETKGDAASAMPLRAVVRD